MRLQKLISNHQPQYLQIGDYTVLKIRAGSSFPQMEGKHFDAILADHERTLSDVLKSDRHYLKPLFTTVPTERQSDGLVNASDLYGIAQKIDVLKQAIQEFENCPLPSQKEERLLVKLLRYIISRKISLHPRNSRSSSIGYHYTLIEDMSIETNPLYILDRLGQFAKRDYFSTSLLDKVNLCYECHGSYLNFSECCTKCNSLDLKTEELIHHFRCAYVGPQSDFVKDGQLICPKCDHRLKHIGIDYDKPSEIHTCKSCDHSSQETKMKAKCTDCLKENELSQIVTHNIYSFHATEKGRTLALSSGPQDTLDHTHSDHPDFLVKMDLFNILKNHETKRKHSKFESTYHLSISISESMISNLNDRMQISLLEEIAQIIHPYLQANDLLAIDTFKNIQLLIIDYTKDSCSDLIEMLTYNLNKMFRDNEWSDEDTITISSNNIAS